MSNDEVRGTLIEVLRGYLRVPPGEAVEMARPLNEQGLDSMSAINLMLDLEQAFGLSIPDELLTAETFHSAASLEATVHRLRGATA